MWQKSPHIWGSEVNFVCVKETHSRGEEFLPPEETNQSFFGGSLTVKKKREMRNKDASQEILPKN